MSNSQTKTICFFNTHKSWTEIEEWHLKVATESKAIGGNPFIVTHLRSQLADKAVREHIMAYRFHVGGLSFLNPVKILILALLFKVKKTDSIVIDYTTDLKLAGLAAKVAGVKEIIYRGKEKLSGFLFESIIKPKVQTTL